MSKDFYGILSLPRTARPGEIKGRFRELARERHPDRFQGAEKEKAELAFQELTEALNVLMDPVRRRQHDLELDQPTGKVAHDPGQVSQAYMKLGIRAFKAGNYAEAAAHFVRATQEQPDSHQAWHHLALASSKEKRWLSKAQDAIVHACELRPRHVPYLKLAGKIFADSGMASRAKQYYNQALKEGGPDLTVRKALEALGGAPKKEQEKGKPGLFRKVW